MDLPLKAIRVLDLSRLLPGAYASQMLADFGADVIRVEEPTSGDYTRTIPPSGPGNMSLYFLAINRNKRSIALNLKSEQGRAIFLRLVRDVDVILESFRPGVMERLGLGYERLKQEKRDLIYCAITGYGQDGPYQQRAGHDLNYAGYAGLLHYQRDSSGKPLLPATQFGDLAGGSYMALVGILTAIVGRSANGEGRFIDVAMNEGLMALMPLIMAAYLNTGKIPTPGQSSLDGGLPGYNIYETKDGKYVTLAALEPKFWHAFCTRIGHLELLPFHSPVGRGERDQALEMLRSIFKTRTRDEWLAEFSEVDACVGPVYTPEEALRDPHIQARKLILEKDGYKALTSFPHISGMEVEQRYPAPTLGEHTNVILREAGYNDEELQHLRAEGVIE